jgi:hypothetical protein
MARHGERIRTSRPNQVWVARTVSTTLALDALDQALHAPQDGHGLIRMG